VTQPDFLGLDDLIGQRGHVGRVGVLDLTAQRE
jgi:hypothetical protein